MKLKRFRLIHFKIQRPFICVSLVCLKNVVKHSSMIHFQYFPRNATHDPSNGANQNATLWDYATMEEYLKPVKRTVSHLPLLVICKAWFLQIMTHDMKIYDSVVLTTQSFNLTVIHQSTKRVAFDLHTSCNICYCLVMTQ